jgi:hypothetical protein
MVTGSDMPFPLLGPSQQRSRSSVRNNRSRDSTARSHRPIPHKKEVQNKEVSVRNSFQAFHNCHSTFLSTYPKRTLCYLSLEEGYRQFFSNLPPWQFTTLARWFVPVFFVKVLLNASSAAIVPSKIFKYPR